MSKVLTEQDIDVFLKEINGDDLKKLFDTSVLSFIKMKPQEEIEAKLVKYWEYTVPVNLGDIIEINGLKYVVTCIYTDKTVDLLSEDIIKINTGLYKANITKVGELECITE